MLEFLASLPTAQIPVEIAVVASAFVISIAFAFAALIRNRRNLRDALESDGDIGAIFENPSSILPHIIELRQRLINSAIAVLAGTLIAALITDPILTLFIRPLDTVGGQEALIAIGVTEPFAVFFRVSIVVGIILASPYVISQVWIFVAAGLKANERRVFYLFVPFAVLLFMSGVAFAYLAMLPVAIPFLVQFMGFNATPTLENYIKFVSSVLLWVGISFEMPMVMFALAKAHIVNARMLAKNWRIAIVGIAVLAAVVTPTPDPVNMGIVAAPLIVLYLLSIVLALLA
jgi:sec-independent protein translocase protein TatC